ncbi:hypothetical protein HDU86_002445 [Geranomyces michiganensis]|nr:hypothetical protein HDU86_002445 [Geranomyces michiganensis]
MLKVTREDGDFLIPTSEHVFAQKTKNALVQAARNGSGTCAPHVPIAKKFRDWAAQILQVAQLGTVATLRKPLGITATGVRDDDVVVKWGATTELADRLRKHKADLGAIRNVQLEVFRISLIDASECTKAEMEIAHLVECQQLAH